MAKGEEIVKYMTQKFVQYLETPRELRKEERMRRRAASEPWTTRWFGMIPFSLSMLFRRDKPKSGD